MLPGLSGPPVAFLVPMLTNRQRFGWRMGLLPGDPVTVPAKRTACWRRRVCLALRMAPLVASAMPAGPSRPPMSSPR